MEKIKRFVEQLCEENGSKYKAKVLNEHIGDADIATFLEYYFNPFKVTNISSKKIVKRPGTFVETRMIKDWKDFIKFLVDECSGRDKDIRAIQNFIQFNKDYEEFLRGVATKSIKMGISAKTLNEIYGEDFVPEVKLQLAAKYFDNKDKIRGKTFSLSLKLDGIRCIIIKNFDKVSMMTRAGRPIFEANEILDELSNVPANFVLDGELLPKGWKDMESKEAYKLATELVKTNGPKRGLVFVAFDMLSLSEWEERESRDKYKRRIKNLKNLVEGMTNIQMVPRYYVGDDLDKVDEILDKVKANNQEGLMVNLVDEVYQFGRTTALLKVKVMQDCDLEVVGVQEGKGKYRGTLGALVVEYKGNTVNVGSGISDVLRDKIWKHQKAIIGRVIKVQYFEETNDSTGKKSIRFPVFLEICPKGKEPSNY